MLAEEIIMAIGTLDSEGYSYDKRTIAKELVGSETLKESLLRKWSMFYSVHELSMAVDQVRTVSYNQIVELGQYVNVHVLSSGYSVGSTNWIFEMGRSSSFSYRLGLINRSSSLGTHTTGLQFDKLIQCDHIVMNQPSRYNNVNPNAVITAFCSTITNLLSSGYVILIPCHSTGVIYDLIECLESQLSSSSELKDTSILIVSPVISQSLSFLNYFCEFLDDDRRDRTLQPDHPFDHYKLMKTNRLKIFDNIFSNQSNIGEDENCSNTHLTGDQRVHCFGKSLKQSKQIIFAGHPSLRFGEITYLMEMYRDCDKSALVFVEPEFSEDNQISKWLAPYQPIQMKCFFYPLDTSLSSEQTSILLRQLKPNALIAMENCYQLHNAKCQLESSGIAVHSCSQYNTLNLPLSIPLVEIRPLDVEMDRTLLDRVHFALSNNTSDPRWCIGHFAAIKSDPIPGRHQPSSYSGGLASFRACDISQYQEQLKYFFRDRFYPCQSATSLSTMENFIDMASIRSALEDNSYLNEIVDNSKSDSTVISIRNYEDPSWSMIFDLPHGDSISVNRNSRTLLIGCNDIQRRKLLKRAIKSLFVNLIPSAKPESSAVTRS